MHVENEISNLSSSRYMEALRALNITDNQKSILQVHHAAPCHRASVRQIAYGVGYPDWNTINLHYGKFASKLCDYLNIHPNTRLSIISSFDKHENEEYHLTMRQAFVVAIEALEIVNKQFQATDEEYAPEARLFEGSVYQTTVNAYERNPIARSICIKHYGAKCHICGFDYAKQYGEFAKGYIQVHHLIPLNEIKSEYQVDPIKDLRPLCANCHSIIHSQRKSLSIEMIKEHLNATAGHA